MKNYKYKFERPVIDLSTSEKLKDFDEVVTRVNNTKQYKFIKNATVLTIGLALVSFMVFFYSNNENPDSHNKQIVHSIEEQNSENNDSLKNTIKDDNKSLSENPALMEDSSENSAPKKQEVQPDEILSQNESPDDYKKLEESLPPKREFIQAVPVSGFEELFEYFGNDMPYPDSLKIKGFEGTVVVEFSVTKNGQIEKAKVIESVHPVLDSIALSAVKNMPEWKPATLNGQPFETKHSIPLIFQIENE